MTPLERCRAYVGKMDPAISGSGGDLATLKVAMVCHDLGLSEPDAMTVMREFNDRCQPRWSEAELLAKVRSAARSAAKPAGWKLDERGCRPAPPPPSPPVAPKPPEPLPALREPTTPQIRSIAALRAVPAGVVWTLSKWGILRVCKYGRSAVDSFAIRAGDSLQLRRLDGKPWSRADGSTYKARNLAGRSFGWNLTPGNGRVLLLEGGIAVMEGLGAIDAAGAEKATGPAWSVLAAPSAGASIPAEILQRLAGRHVRIAPDANRAGVQTVFKWTAQLQSAGCSVDVRLIPEAHSDLGDLLKTLPKHQQFLTELFQ